MKFFIILLSVHFGVVATKGTDRTFIGSTPAASDVRNFLQIPLADSIDFIRWKIVLSENSYQLNCNYGIGKPNTNGFINGGKTITLKGTLNREKDVYKLLNGQRSLMMVSLNDDLFHLLDKNKKLLIGNGGWSYTLNNASPKHLSVLNFTSDKAIARDSMVFDGRTPCGVPGIVEQGKNCYKLKWRITLYPKAGNEIAKCKILGTGMRPYGKAGKWNIVNAKNGKVVYEISDDDGKPLLHLLKLDENVLAFIDSDGKLLVGNEDFSYTLNRVK